jgi:hypothetical protein
LAAKVEATEQLSTTRTKLSDGEARRHVRIKTISLRRIADFDDRPTQLEGSRRRHLDGELCEYRQVGETQRRRIN